MTTAERYVFEGGYPTTETVQRAYDDADLNRAVSCYRFFYPTVSILATWKGNLEAGMVPNKVFGILEGTPQQLVFTPNSDTPYAGLPLDMSGGPMVVELPPGPLMCTANDMNQRWVLDMGLPGPDGGKGGKHLVCGPGHGGAVPEGFYTGRATTNRVLVLLRALPHGDDMAGAIEEIKKVKVYPLGSTGDAAEVSWVNLSELRGADFTPLRWEDNLEFWKVLHEVIDGNRLRGVPGVLRRTRRLGIAKGRAFDPDERMTDILIRAAQIGAPSCACSRSPIAARTGSSGRARSGNGRCCDLRTALSTSPNTTTATPARSGSTKHRSNPRRCSAAARAPDRCTGSAPATPPAPTSTAPAPTPFQYLQPVPAKLFWSVTVYDARTRSEIATDQNEAALRSMFELAGIDATQPAVLHFGPTAPPGDAAGRWIQTIPGVGWFVYFRIYGPDGPSLRRHLATSRLRTRLNRTRTDSLSSAPSWRRSEWIRSIDPQPAPGCPD